MSTLLYSQENVSVIWQNVQWGGYTGVNAGGCGAHTWFPSSGTSSYPFPNFVSDASFQPMTFYAGDGQGNNAIGIATADPYLLNGLQGGSTVGMLLAPRSITSAGVSYAVLANWWFCTYPKPWLNGSGIQMNMDAVMPFVYVPWVGSGLISEMGTVFAYYVVLIQNVNDPTQQIYICPRLLQNQYPQGADVGTAATWDFGPGDQVSYDSANSIAILYPELGTSSSWISSNGNGSFNIGSNPYTKTYSFTMSSSQLSAAIAAINASGRTPRSDYDTTAANWQVRLLNLNCEAWAPSGADPRFGLSFTGLQLWQL